MATKTKLSAKAAMRVKIAKDALKQIAAKRIVPTHGIYLDLSKNNEYVIKSDENLLKMIESPNVECEVCAIGAIIVGYASATDKTLSHRQSDKILDDYLYSGPNTGILKYFDRYQVNLIESSFEKVPAGDDATPRLKGILQNIVTNDGTFRPEA